MSSRAKKSAALQDLKSRRTGNFSGTRVEDYQITKEDDVYDKFNDDEYRELMKRRGEREDFVVDDDGLGYHDDGEEHYNDDEPSDMRRADASAIAITANVLKKAKKDKALLQSSNDFVDGHGDGTIGKNRSMWDFVQVGPVLKAAPPTANVDHVTSTSKSSSSLLPRVSMLQSEGHNFDSLLDKLDEIGHVPPVAKRRRVTQVQSLRKQVSHPNTQAHTSRSSHVWSSSQPKQSQTRSRPPHKLPTLYDEQEDYDTQDTFQFNNFDPEEEDVESANFTSNIGVDDVKMEINSSSIHVKTEQVLAQCGNTVDDYTGASDKDEPFQVAGIQKNARKRLISSSRQYLVPDISKPPDEPIHPVDNTINSVTISPLPISNLPPNVDFNSSSFKPTVISVDDTAAASSALPANLESIVQTEAMSDSSRNYVDFFWLDIQEKNGNIFLFGKVEAACPIDESGQQQQDIAKRFISCCAVVKNNQRCLFVLPRLKEDGSGEYESMQDVHAEVKTILQPKCIPQIAGATWGGKVVKRKYAFGDSDVPRDEKSYLKIVYDAKYPAPERSVCLGGNLKFIHKIFGSGATPMENFILKRKLMGPCWLRFYDITPVTSPVSWCKIELSVNSPKNVIRYDTLTTGKEKDSIAMGPPRPVPPVTTVTIKLKTVVNAKTQKSEVVSLTAICHRQVLVDVATEESFKQMTQLSLIRPIPVISTSNAVSTAQFPRDLDSELKVGMPQLAQMPNERALLNRFFTQLGLWDPDIIVGHNAWGYDLEVLLSRCIENKVPAWSKIGRTRRSDFPKPSYFQGGKDWAIAEVLTGRLVCDIYLSAKELLKETTYTLENLTKTQLKAQRIDIDPVDIPLWFASGKTIVQLAKHTLNDAQLVQRLMFKLQILPLTKQLTCIAGNLWSRTLKGNRAERNEYLLLHEFHKLKYILPEKETPKQRRELLGSEGNGKAKYSGGLVLEPKKGLYDSYILLLDFNSLYPSIIQEYNLCFTTVDWSNFKGTKDLSTGGGKPSNKLDDDDEGDEVEMDAGLLSNENLPPLPERSVDTGVLPRVIKSLVDRRRNVKNILKNERNLEKQQELNIRQMALKLTANSMYGCLGFSNSRFFAQPIAALVTAMGRETLQRSVKVAEDNFGLDVIYGDTDSIMINTRIPGKELGELSKVYELGDSVKREVNKLYKTLELEVDGVFRSMLLLKKKKYAAITVEKGWDCNPVIGKETKGLDLVRRDWCIQSKDTGRYVLDQILSGHEREVVISKIHEHLEDLAKKMRSGELPLDKYVITKGLSKHPNDYPDAKSQPHVQVAKMMLKANKHVNTGDHIPYIITKAESVESSEGKNSNTNTSSSPAERARHPEDIIRSAGVLKPDVEWYLTQQILPPIARLCEPIDGTSQSLIAEKLGLESLRFNNQIFTASEIDDKALVDFTPSSCLPDSERFKNVEKFTVVCQSCRTLVELTGAFRCIKNQNGDFSVSSGFRCPNAGCKKPTCFGFEKHINLLSVLSNKIDLMVRRHIGLYSKHENMCDDPACHLKSTQVSVVGDVCLARGCNGIMKPLVGADKLDTQLKYIKSIFDTNHTHKELERLYEAVPPFKVLLKSWKDSETTSDYDKEVADILCHKMNVILQKSRYNIIEPSFFQNLFLALKQ